LRLDFGLLGLIVNLDQLNQSMAHKDWLSAGEAMDALGVRPQTLYAYVSRGRIEARSQDADPRKSLYRAADVAELAKRKRQGRKAAQVAASAIAWGEPMLASAITTIHGGKLFYRGVDAAELARTASLEQAAELLWQAPESPFSSGIASPPLGASPRGRMFALLAARAATDAAARGRGPAALLPEAGALVLAIADAIAGQSGTGPIHQRLASAWRCDAEGADLIRRTLVLAADHELNASTFAARVTASTGASLAAATLSGLAALSGPLHGGMSARVQVFVQETLKVGAERAVRARIEAGLPVPGFGHPLYPAGDPRAAALLDAFPLTPEYQAILDATLAVTGERPNIDFALTALTWSLDLPDEAPFLMFAMARSVGWIAHALEQVQTGHLIRPRARYVGPAIA
jgi:citrate synthase